MLSLPDLKEKRVVFIPSDGKLENSLKFRNNNISLYREGKLINKVSCHLVISVYILGECTITSQLVKKLKSYGISLFMLDNSLKAYAMIMSEAEGNYIIRGKQYRADKNSELNLAKILISNKVTNQYRLMKVLQHKPDKVAYESTLKSIEVAKDDKSILGLEGNYSSIYFKTIFGEYEWYRRAPRTKEDLSNLLLDIGYTYMFNFVDSLLLLFGFDTYKGVYHKLFFQRKSLSCDIMEPFRPLIDRQLVKSYNLGQIDPKDFGFKNGSYYLKSWEHHKKYSNMWFELIMDNREEIYNYVLSYYRYIQDQEKYPKPEYIL